MLLHIFILFVFIQICFSPSKEELSKALNLSNENKIHRNVLLNQAKKVSQSSTWLDVNG